MSLISAVDRLYQSRWLPSDDHPDLPRLPDGRRYPALPHIKREFNDLGLSLRITETPDEVEQVIAQWAPVGEAIIVTNQQDPQNLDPDRGQTQKHKTSQQRHQFGAERQTQGGIAGLNDKSGPRDPDQTGSEQAQPPAQHHPRDL